MPFFKVSFSFYISYSLSQKSNRYYAATKTGGDTDDNVVYAVAGTQLENNPAYAMIRGRIENNPAYGMTGRRMEDNPAYAASRRIERSPAYGANRARMQQPIARLPPGMQQESDYEPIPI